MSHKKHVKTQVDEKWKSLSDFISTHCAISLLSTSIALPFFANFKAQLVEIDSGEELLFLNSKILMFSQHLFFTLKKLINARKKHFNKNGFAKLI